MVASYGESERNVLVGVFESDADAQRCVEELRRAGFREDQVGVVARDGVATIGDAKADYDSGGTIAAGTATGAVAGAGVGALWALGMAAGAVPVIGPVVVGGLLATVLASAATGAVAGSIVGALVGLGVPEAEAARYEQELHAGRVLVTVRPEARADLAVDTLRRHGARAVTTESAAANPRPTGP